MTFAEALKAARKSKRVSRKDAGFSVGVSEVAIYYWESGKTSPRIHHAIRAAKALGFSLDALDHDDLPPDNLQAGYIEKSVDAINDRPKVASGISKI